MGKLINTRYITYRRKYTRVAQIKILYFTILINVGNVSRGHCWEAVENQEASISNKVSSKTGIQNLGVCLLGIYGNLKVPSIESFEGFCMNEYAFSSWQNLCCFK